MKDLEQLYGKSDVRFFLLSSLELVTALPTHDVFHLEPAEFHDDTCVFEAFEIGAVTKRHVRLRGLEMSG